MHRLSEGTYASRGRSRRALGTRPAKELLLKSRKLTMKIKVDAGRSEALELMCYLHKR